MRIRTITLLLIICTSIISCGEDTSNHLTPGPISSYAQQKVAISNGINTKTGKSIPLNPLTGIEIKSCGGINIETPAEDYTTEMKEKGRPDQTKETIQEKQECLTKLIGLTPEQQNLINGTRTTSNVTIQVGEEKRKGILTLSASVSFEGSYCETQYTAGQQYENCVTLEETCMALNTLKKKKRKKYNSLCGEFPFWNN